MVISLTFGGGEIASFRLIQMLARFNLLGNLILIFPRMISSITNMRKLKEYLKNLGIQMDENSFIGVYRNKFEFVVLVIKALKFAYKKFDNRSKVCVMIDTPELVFPSLFLKIIKPKLKLVIITHGTFESALFAFKVKGKFFPMLYSFVQMLTYKFFMVFFNLRLTFIPNSSSKYIHIPFPIKLNIIQSSTNEYRNNILYMGRLQQRVKGWLDAVRAYNNFVLNTIYRKSTFTTLTSLPKLIIAGDGPEKYLALKISNNSNHLIDFIGFVDEPEKTKVLSHTRVLLLPSRHESFPIIVLEALASQVVIVTYEEPWIRYLPRKLQKSILTARPYDISDLTAKLEKAFIYYEQFKPNLRDLNELRNLSDEQQCERILYYYFKKICHTS